MELSYDLIQAIANKHNFWFDFAGEYGEPGYDLPEGKKGIVMANWNEVPEHIANAIEKQWEIEWSDEWVVTYYNGESKAYRCSGDSYCWKPSFVILDGEVLGLEEILEDPEPYIETLINDSNKINTFDDISLEELGFELIEDKFEHGWYGQCDHPADILSKLLEKHPDGEFVFSDLENEQFRSNFSVYGRNLAQDSE